MAKKKIIKEYDHIFNVQVNLTNGEFYTFLEAAKLSEDITLKDLLCKLAEHPEYSFHELLVITFIHLGLDDLYAKAKASIYFTETDNENI